MGTARRFLALILLAATHLAHAQTSASGTVIPPATQLVDSTGIVWTVTGGVIDRNGVADPLTKNVVTLLYFNGLIYQQSTNQAGWWSWTNNAWLAVPGDPRPVAVPCLPKLTVASPAQVRVGAIPASVGSTVNDSYAVWVCNTPTGYVTTGALFKLLDIAAQIVQYAAGSLTTAQVNTLCTTMCTPLTPAEATYLNALIAQNVPPAVVQDNGPTKTRVVFSANAGALGPPSGNSRVKTGAPCNPANRIPGTAYYSVQGQPDVATPGTKLGAVYALCTVTLPLSAN